MKRFMFLLAAIEILDADPNEPEVLILNGRLQHVTEKWQWLFFEDKPDAKF
jgi:hypothetical protein